MIKEVFVYTDGSASVAGKFAGRGGFGTYFPENEIFGVPKGYSLGFLKAKTGQMEVLALLFAIKAMPVRYSESIKLSVYSDSEYVVKSFTENRLEKWRSNGWTNSSGKVANKELWIEVLHELSLRRYLQISLNHIKSHQVESEKDPQLKKKLLENPHIVGNLMVDKLADYKRHQNPLEDITCI